MLFIFIFVIYPGDTLSLLIRVLILKKQVKLHVSINKYVGTYIYII